MAGRRKGVLARTLGKLRLAGALALFFAAQLVRGRLRRRLVLRAHALDPSAGVPLLHLARRGSVGPLIAEAAAIAGRKDGVAGEASDHLLEDALFSLVVSRIDAARHPRAELAVRFAAQMLAAERSASASQLGQDLFVTLVLGDRRGEGYFVEFGAADGVELSNTLRLERDLGWSGLLAEPNPAHAEPLRRNRRCAISDRCVWSRSGDRLSFSAVDTVPAYSTLSEFRASDHIDRTSARSIEVETVSLVDLLRQHGAPRRIDYMSIDTEGSELEILRSFDFEAYDVGVFTIEHNFTAIRAEIRRLLGRHGYVRVLEGFSKWDDWYVSAEIARRLGVRDSAP